MYKSSFRCTNSYLFQCCLCWFAYCLLAYVCVRVCVCVCVCQEMGDAVQTCISLLSDALIHIYFSVACAGLHTCVCVCVCVRKWVTLCKYMYKSSFRCTNSYLFQCCLCWFAYCLLAYVCVCVCVCVCQEVGDAMQIHV